MRIPTSSAAASTAAGPAPTLMFVVTEDWYFVTHRLPLARAARDAGYRVLIASRFGEHLEQLAGEGFVPVALRLRRRGAGLAGEVAAILELRRLYREHQVSVVHHVALKPVVFGSLAALGQSRLGVVNAIAGLGFLFSSDRLTARLLRPAMRLALRVVLRRPRSVVVVQNEEDRAQLLAHRLAAPAQVRLMPGAGVDLAEFRTMPEPGGVPVVGFAGRLLWDKGVGRFVEAARLLKADGVAARFVLVGAPDHDNPGAVPEATLDGWTAEGVVERWGRRQDMPAVLGALHVLCLPSSYGEGVPKILLEAAACGRPVVTTDWPGCRSAVRDGETGLLVPPGDVPALAAALARLAGDATLRQRMGAAGRALAEAEFDVRQVAAATLAVYEEVRA